MNYFYSILLIFLYSTNIFSQEKEYFIIENLKEVAKTLNTEQAISLWGFSLEGDIIFIDSKNNKLYICSIENGTARILHKTPWDNKIPLANTVIDYEGKKYSTIIYDKLIEDVNESGKKLIIHELFHLHQSKLNIPMVTSRNYHLDTPQGRALLRCEILALEKALLGDIKSLEEALSIKSYRQKLYPDNNENEFELSEGLPEYTGIKLSIENTKSYLLQKLKYQPNMGYTNSFAYKTGSAYCFLLDNLYSNWKKDVNLSKGLYQLFYMNEYVDYDTEKILQSYNYYQYFDEENKMNSEVFKYVELFKSHPDRLIIHNDGVNITFDPNDLVYSIDEESVLIKNVTLKGQWGILRASNGLIRLNNWKAFYLLPPNSIDDLLIKGDNYVLELNPEWCIQKKDSFWEIYNKR